MRRLVATLSGLALVLSGAGASARTLPNYDALQDAKPAGRATAGFKLVNAKGARIAHRDSLTDSPTFIWVNKSGAPSKLSAQFAKMAPEKAALAQLADHAPLYGLSSFESAGARVTSVNQNRQGVKVVTLTQEAAGIEVFRQSIRLMLNRNNELVAISGNLSKHVSAEVPAARVRFQLPASEAIAVAYKDLTGNTLDGSLLTQVNKLDSGKYVHYSLASYARPLAEELVIPARAKQVLFSLPNALVPAYYVELNTGRPDGKDSDYYSYVVSAVDGRLLMRTNLTADAEYSYRVFADSTPPYTPHDGPSGSNATPHPTGTPGTFAPSFVPPALVTLQNVPYSQNDPWLPDGATETKGNNVDAYADLVAPDNYNTGDLRPTVTAPGVFDRTMLFDIQPNANADQIAAATTSLFFLNNWLHDWYYDAGFDEASGNAQTDNYGRGGLANDAIRAQAQDHGGINNANMSTPADGASPRMQMYLFSGLQEAHLTANAPASVAGEYEVGVAAGFGPQFFNVTGDVVIAQDESNSSGASTTDACTALTNAADVAGKIALVDRGSCNFTVKVTNAQTAGAIGVIVADNVAGPVVGIGGDATNITIPALRITLADGNKLRAAPGLNVTLFRAESLSLDGTVDNGIVAHEWGHYISNRLVSNAAGLGNNQGGSMGEGWGDFTALLMMARAEDINVPSNANWNGAYGAGEFATRGSSEDSAFFGIRRVTYSADLAKNALTFRHIMDGVPLPTTTPISPNSFPNSEVHNAGEVWATMLWECYVALLRAHPFQEAQDRMKSYLVNGYKMTPASPTYLEARDAVLAAAFANDPADGERLWAAFAKRGAGVGAVAPDRYSTNHAGVVESFEVGTNVEIVSVEFDDDLATSSCDKDGILDNGETGRLIITVRNTGSTAAKSTSVTVFSGTRGVTVGNAGSVSFPEIPMGGQAEASIPVSLHGAATGSAVSFNFAIRDENQAHPGDKTDSLAFKVNYDEAPATSATETVDALTPPWSTEFNDTLAEGYFETVVFSDLNRAFYGPNMGMASDIRLITPPLQVSADQPLVLSFDHAYDFEADASGNYDGAVIELSEDNGATWVDIGESLYTGTLVSYSGNGNPLQGQKAIVGSSADFPTFTKATLNLGTTYAGKTVQIRFRIGTDNAAAFTGWVLDNLAFSGITNTPFTTMTEENNVCSNRPPVANAGADVTAVENTKVTLTGSASDEDGDSLSYSWTQESGPAVTLSGADTLTPSFTAPAVTGDSEVVLKLTVNDGSTTASDTVTVRVKNVNHAPTVNAGLDGSVKSGESFTLSGSASDTDGDTLSAYWVQVSGTPVALSGANTLQATFTAPQTASGETLTFVLVVSDGSVTTSDLVDVAVTPADPVENQAPVAKARVIVSGKQTSLTLDGSGSSDPEGDALTYKWEQTGGPAVQLGDANQAVLSVDVTEEATYTFRLTVTDADGATNSATVEATAKPDHGGGDDDDDDDHGGCSATGGGAPVGLLGLALMGLLNRRRRMN